MKSIRAFLGAAALALCAPLQAQPAGEARGSAIDGLLALDLEGLLQVRLTLGTRTEASVLDTPAAVYVLQRDDILRSGHRRLADVLRLLPGVHVGRSDANRWGVATRNGLNRFSSTMLVMIDGRHVYTPLFGGVRWEVQDLPLDDIERIELVRGPGGPLWGANAVDGIVHIITRSAAATGGLRAELAAGSGALSHEAALRAGQASEAGWSWRLHARDSATEAGRYLPAQQSNHRGLREAGARADDDGRGQSLHARADWAGGADQLSLTAGASSHRLGEERVLAGQLRPNSVHEQGGFASADWRRRLGAPGDELRVRLSADRALFDDDILRDDQWLIDLDAQHSTALGAGHRLTWGLGWRLYRSGFQPPDGQPCNGCFGLYPPLHAERTTSAFVQHQWAVTPALGLTAGTKVEHGAAGVQWQPTLRASWRLAPEQALWAAWTRPVRTPTRSEREQAFFNLPPEQVPVFRCRRYDEADRICVVGDPGARAWWVRSAEAGYRGRLAPELELDLALFDLRYDYRMHAPQATDRLASHLRGAELVLRWQPAGNWRGEAIAAWHEGHDHYADGSTWAVAQMPRESLLLRSRWSPAPGWTLDGELEHRGAIDRPRFAPLVRYAPASQLHLRAAWQPDARNEWSLAALNLGDDRTGEVLETNKVNTVAGRSLVLAWAGRF